VNPLRSDATHFESPSGSTPVTVAFLYSLPSIVLKSSASAIDAKQQIKTTKLGEFIPGTLNLLPRFEGISSACQAARRIPIAAAAALRPTQSIYSLLTAGKDNYNCQPPRLEIAEEYSISQNGGLARLVLLSIDGNRFHHPADFCQCIRAFCGPDSKRNWYGTDRFSGGVDFLVTEHRDLGVGVH
jgi:hypothetical protein